MFVVMYRWRLKPGQEAAFREGWERITRLAHARCGSLGSALLTGDDGVWCAVARWPSREAREVCFAQSLDDAASELMRDAVAERLPAVEMDMVLDLWAAPISLAKETE